MYLASTDEANELLANDPLALLVGMLLDQQIPMEKAFTSPAVLAERMGGGGLDVQTIASYEPEQFEMLFRTPPALHRFPAAMAKRTQELARIIVERFDSDPASVWTNARDGKELIARVGALPGFGRQKAQIFTALLGKQYGVKTRGWREAAGEFGPKGALNSVADVVDEKSLKAVRAYKQQLKAAGKAKAATAD